MQNLDVKMVHENLAATPKFALPASFAIQFYVPGREADWLRIQERADDYNSFSPFVFMDQFKQYADSLIDSQIYVLNQQGESIATATAWRDDRTEYSGRVHWIATLPEYQGQGIGKALLTLVCRKLLANGHAKGSLSTSTARIAAIKMYLKYGFVPLIQSELDEYNWHVFESQSDIRALS